MFHQINSYYDWKKEDKVLKNPIQKKNKSI